MPDFVSIERALETLRDNPQLLQQERGRYNDPPPPYAESQGSTQLESPEPESNELPRRKDRTQLIKQHNASRPYNQLRAHVQEEMNRLWKADPRVSSRGLMPIALYDKPAREAVKKSWIEQGIWDDGWERSEIWYWKHEVPLEPELGTATATNADDGCLQRQQQQQRREASRPYHQFIHQIGKERERIEEEKGSKVDVNTEAYNHVKSVWVKQMIWDERWGILPGMSWKHEEPLEDEEEEEDHSAQANPRNVRFGSDTAPQASESNRPRHAAGDRVQTSLFQRVNLGRPADEPPNEDMPRQPLMNMSLSPVRSRKTSQQPSLSSPPRRSERLRPMDTSKPQGVQKGQPSRVATRKTKRKKT